MVNVQQQHQQQQVIITTSAMLLLLPFAAGAVLASASPLGNSDTDDNNPELIWTGRKTRATQYHTQDASSGAYQYGYTGPHHAKSESSFNGVTRGGYSYIDANGLTQTVSYTADAENGFRVHASNLPSRNALNPVQDTPEVALAKRRHLDQLRKLESWQQRQQQQQQQYQDDGRYSAADQPRPRQRSRSGSSSPFLLSAEEARSIPSAPRPSNSIIVEADDGVKNDESDGSSGNNNNYDAGDYDAGLEPPRLFGASSSSVHLHPQHQQHYVLPAVAPAQHFMLAMPVPLIHSSMSHSQDSLGQYSYSYTGDTSAKTESRSLDGTTRGAYSYIDANGILQHVHYIADSGGFRVLATNLPEA